jgi:hypothetical protein
MTTHQASVCGHPRTLNAGRQSASGNEISHLKHRIDDLSAVYDPNIRKRID